MNTYKQISLFAASLGSIALLLAGTSAFAAGPSLFGDATQDTNVVHLVSDSSSTPAYGGISFPTASTTLASFVSSGDLSATYNVLDTECGGGSPRFQINVASSTDASSTADIFAYLGPPPNYTGCAQNTAVDSGNLLNGTSTLDTSQLPGGTFYDTLSHALSAYGDYNVTGVQLVADGGWAVSGGVQDVDVGTADVGGTSYMLGSGGATTTLVAPTLISPTNGQTLTSGNFTSASWSAMTGSSTPITYQYESSLSSSTNADGSLVDPAYQSGWLSTNSISTTGTPPGTYYWNVRAMDNSGDLSPWSSVGTFIITNTTSTGTTTPPSDVSQVVAALQSLEAQFPSLTGPIQALINELLGSGTTVGNTGSASIDQNGSSVNAGGTLDFAGRNFGHEEGVTVTLNGATVANAHADGGGNFSTGSITAPATPGTYLYTFTGSSGDSATATVTVM